MKFIKAAIMAGMIMLQGCAASYIQYDVSGGGNCPPIVIADAGMGVSVRVNDGRPGDRCHAPE
ncbi:hypothetical protein D3C84_88970 [compost metagenome]